MASLSASKKDQKEASYLDNTSLPQYQPVANRTRSSQHLPKPSAETQVEGENSHARQKVYPTVSDGMKVSVRPQRARQQSYQDPDLQLGSQECGVASPPNTRRCRHAQTWRRSDLQNESPLNKHPSLHRLGKEECYLKPGSHSDFDPSTPPPPSDLEALRRTWEQVRLYNMKNIKSPKPISAMSSTISTINEEEVLASRGGRIQWRVHLGASQKWTDLRKTVEEELRGDSSIQDQFQRAGIWLVQETEDEGSEIEKRISYLEENNPTMKAEWSVGFWQKYFFKCCSAHETILQIYRERRQTHTLKPSTSDNEVSSSTQENEEKPTENRYPPILPNIQSRHSVLVSETPYDVDPNRRKDCYAFSDISYAINIGEDLSQEHLVLIKSLPTIRLYQAATHYLEGEKIEVKPLNNEYWSGDQTYRFAVRHLTLTGMIMLHEYLKLCYMSSKDEDFFPEPEDLSIQLIVGVGYTASHYIHRIRHEPEVGQPLKYESYWLASFNLKEAGERNRFRERLNKIHVLHVTAFKKAVKEKLEEVLALGKREIRRRLKSGLTRMCDSFVQCVIMYGDSVWIAMAKIRLFIPLGPLTSPKPKNSKTTRIALWQHLYPKLPPLKSVRRTEDPGAEHCNNDQNHNARTLPERVNCHAG